MIIYKETLNNFLLDIKNQNLITKLCLELDNKKGIKPSDKEKESWRTTLVNVSKDIEKINNKDEQFILLEFVLPNHKKRIDVLLVGSDGKNNNLAIIELKGWSKIEEIQNSKFIKPNTSYSFFGLLHPAYEAFDYSNILKDQYSDINDIFKIYPISYLPNYEAEKNNVLNNPIKYQDILNYVDLYWKSNKQELIDWFKLKFQNAISIDKVNYLNKLEYKPSKSFIEHAKNKFEDIKLIGSQRNVFEVISHMIDLNKETNKKTVFIISGAAGSGKSIVAFKLLLKLISEKYNTRLMMPGIEFRQAIKKQFGNNVFVEKIGGAYSKTKCDYVIVDEAHKATANGTTKQFYNELLKNNQNIIVLLDDFQVINKKGITKQEFIDLSTNKTNHNFACVQLELEEQFRNAGDATYIDWLKHMIFNKDNNQINFVANKFKFEILEGSEFNKEYQSMYDDHNVRMVSFWTQRWNINNLTENGMPIPTAKIADYTYTWNPNNEWLKKINENNPNLKINKELFNLCNKTNFITDKKGFQYIAYFNTIQGSEFDYIFVHIPKLFYLNDNGELDVDFDYLKDKFSNKINKEMESQVYSLNNIKDKKEVEKRINLNKLYFKNRLFICLTRGIKGAYVYFEDKKLNDFFKKHLRKGGRNENN